MGSLPLQPDSCPCGSGAQYADCCEPFIAGAAAPDTAEKLMRSRYSAFVVGAPEYIVGTVHPDKREEHDLESIRSWSASAEWQSLEITETRAGEADDDEGLVEFVALYDEKGNTVRHHELAQFSKVDDRWFFVDGVPVKAKQVRREAPKVGRNDPCPCGSGKKYKKCCGA